MLTKIKYHTARVHWQMGQALLPEHFYAQEEGLRQEVHQRFLMSGVPMWGVARLKWDAFQILHGVVSLQEFSLVLPSGSLIDIPGNTQPTSFSLESAGKSQVSLYVHLETGYDVSSDDEDGLASDEAIERILQRVTLSSVPYLDTAQQSFLLAKFDKDIEGRWQLDGSYIPPMIRLGPSPFFESVLGRMRGMGVSFRQVLTAEIQQSHLGGESQLAAKQCMRSLFRYINSLANIGQEIQPHPYELFCLLRDFYLDVCVYRDSQPRELAFTYKHEAIGDSLEKLLAWSEEQVSCTRSEVPYAVFEQRDGQWVCTLPSGAKRAKDVYWLVQRKHTAEGLDLCGLKLAAPSRAALIYQRALRGIPYERIKRPPFYHSFSGEVDFYVLQPGVEWDYAVREGKVAFFERPDLGDARFFIYWRND